MADKFERFTVGARKTLTLAQGEAHRFNHNYIGTEHLLLGLVHEGDGVAARVLASMDVDLPRVRKAIEHIIGRGDAMIVGEIGLTPRAKKVIELAVDEARHLNHHYIGTEHLLLGLIEEGEGIAAGVLESIGVSRERTRQAVLQAVKQGGEPAEELQPEQPALPTLGDLKRVLAVDQTQIADGVAATILSLEIYDGGTIFHVRFRGGASDWRGGHRIRQLPLLGHMTDDSGTHYSLHAIDWTFLAEDSSFLSVLSAPGLGENVHRLRIHLYSGHDPNEGPPPPQRSANVAVKRAAGTPSPEPEPPPGVRHWEFGVEL